MERNTNHNIYDERSPGRRAQRDCPAQRASRSPKADGRRCGIVISRLGSGAREVKLIGTRFIVSRRNASLSRRLGRLALQAHERLPGATQAQASSPLEVINAPATERRKP